MISTRGTNLRFAVREDINRLKNGHPTAPPLIVARFYYRFLNDFTSRNTAASVRTVMAFRFARDELERQGYEPKKTHADLEIRHLLAVEEPRRDPLIKRLIYGATKLLGLGKKQATAPESETA